jgi:acyl-CoA-dependent ceramide synthase
VFGLFIICWVITRHILYLIVCYSVLHDIPIEIDYGCYYGKKEALGGPISPVDNFKHLFEPFYNPEGLVCFNHNIKWAFLTALLSLQGIFLLWFWMVVRVAGKVLRGGEAEDSRSDEEDQEKHGQGEQMTYNKTEPSGVRLGM